MQLFMVLFFCAFSVFASDEAEIAALQLNVIHRANAYAQEVAQIQNQLAKPLTENIQAEPIQTHLKKVSSVIVFLSFSMPEQSLRAWLLQCKQSGATPVIRGLINNSFKDTMAAIQKLSKKTGMGMQLDPILFKTFEIEAVPAVVYVKDTPLCPANMNCKPVDYDMVYGDVFLDYALEQMTKGEGEEDFLLHQMIRRLRGDLS